MSRFYIIYFNDRTNLYILYIGNDLPLVKFGCFAFLVDINNFSSITGSRGLRKDQGTNATINIKELYKLAGTSDFSGNITKGKTSSRYYRRLVDSKEQNY